MVAVLAVLPFVAGCGGTAARTDEGGGDRTDAGEPWVVVATGSATPSAGPPVRASRKPALPPVSFLPTTGACAVGWPAQDHVLIPMVVTPGTASLTVTWPNRYGNTYRLAAVPQDLVAGAQPEPPWQTVTTGGECEVTATIRGLTSGAAYIVWLDAPDTPRRLDGSRSLYSGRSRIVIPS
jgi:hypothetical protein